MMRLSPGDKRQIAARAATIYERAAVAASIPAVRTPPVTSPKLDHWLRAFSPGNPNAFVRRLAWDALDVASAAAAAELSPSDGWEPDDHWTEWLDRFLEETPGTLDDFRSGQSRESGEPHPGPFGAVWEVMRRAAARAVRTRAAAHARARVSPAAFAALEGQLLSEIGRYADAALFERFRAAVPAGSASTSTGGYRAFVESMLDRGLAGFLVDYPVLAHQLVVIVTSWVERTTELIMRIDADRVALAHTFGAGIATGDVVAIAPALSDPHHGRARVCAVTFGSGLEVVYKPRSVAIEAAFGDLLAWMAPGVAHAPRGLRTLDRATHGWVEVARQGSFANRAHVAAYYYRAGVLLCVTSVLGARDLHRDNVVATSDGPALVDLEMLLQPVLKSAAAAPDAPAGERAAECLATGLLSLIELTPEGEAHDAGGLRGERTGALPFPRRAWLDAGTDALRPIDEPVFSVSGVHEVVLDDVVQRPESWADEIRHGFRDAYRCLLARRDDMLRPDGPLHDFGRCTIRLLPRRTNQYAMLAHLLATPKYQADGIVASCAIDVLHRGYASDESRPELWDVAVEERRAMLALDVPYFSMACDGLDAAAEGRTVAKHYYAKSALDAARDRVRALSEVDLRDQMAVLSRALGESVASRFAAAPFSAGQDDAATFVGCAEWIGRELLSRAVRSDTGALTWPYRDAAGGSVWRAHHLYDGTLGPVLFLAALGRVTRDEVWRDAAHRALQSVREHAGRHPVATLPEDEPIGAGNGLASIVHGLTVASSLGVGSHDELALARGLALSIPERVPASPHVDVIDGAAGAVLAMLALHEATHDADVLAAAAACGDVLLAREYNVGAVSCWPSSDGATLIGFAHGVAGIALALARLADATGDARYANSARRAFRFVRRHHLRPAGGWSIAVAGGRPAGGVMTGWCHGAPGVALAAIGARRLWPEAEGTVRRGVDAALRTVIGAHATQADHVCCGALARAEALVTAGCELGRADLAAAGHAVARQVADRARNRGHFRLCGPGMDYRVFDPGFFQGLSGIGYQFLRMFQPSRLPSITAFVGATEASLRYCSPWPNAVETSGHTPPVPPTGSGGATL